MPGTYYVYVLECSNGRLYTGYTVDLKKRFNEHASALKGAKFTRSFKPRKIIASWQITGSRGDAMKVEAYIKSLPKTEKVIITGNPGTLPDRIRNVKEIGCEIAVYDYDNLILK
jgi:putative endonuclease